MAKDNEQLNANIKTGLLIAGGLIGFKMVKDLLAKLGLGNGPGATNVHNEQENPNSCWKPNFLQAIPPGTNYLVIPEANVQDFISKIHDAFGVFQDDFNTIFSVFSQLKTKSQVSYLSMKFTDKYGEDLLSFLTDGGGLMPWDGLSDAHLATLTNLVSKFPQYTA